MRPLRIINDDPKLRNLRERNINSQRYKQWKEYIHERDQKRCQFPGCKDLSDEIEVHHIKKWADKKAKHLRFATHNGICLCEKHHTQVTGREEYYSMMLYDVVIKNEKAYKLRKAQDNTGHEGTIPI